MKHYLAMAKYIKQKSKTAYEQTLRKGLGDLFSEAAAGALAKTITAHSLYFRLFS
ncbi:hypothetical protein [Psychroflexus sp. MES1-P1E]|uniref:hypothetical protein n=1 Tax=Psychroflexus sp. MES1-P1E TaxID=2058320 RepID=UPI0015E0EF18|nr:hypothetical protein [Psychroflexus sp. MES1-P1E]